MTSIHVVLGPASSKGGSGAAMPVMDSTPVASQTLSGTGSTGFAVPGSGKTDLFWDVSAGAADKWVAFGPAPDPTIDPRWLVKAGSTRTFGARGGDKCGVRDA